MQINIKQMILEGYSYDEITEAIHANHKHLNKKLLKDPTTSYVEGKEIEKNRKSLANDISHSRRQRDDLRNSVVDGGGSADQKRERNQGANYFDNFARARSQTGGKGMDYAKDLKEFSYSEKDKIIKNVPRIISSANK